MRSWILGSLALSFCVACADEPAAAPTPLDAAVPDAAVDAQPDMALDAELDAATPDAEPDATVDAALGWTCDRPPSDRPEGTLRFDDCRLRRGGLDAPPHGVVVAYDSLVREARTPLHEPAHYVELAEHFDLVWLLVTWDGIEPRPQTYNGAYLGRVCQQVAWAEAAGLEVVLAMHQSCWGAAVGGVGMPPWATPAGLSPATPPECEHPSVVAAWAGFDAAQHDAFVAAWVRLLDTCADATGVVGIQPLAQPGLPAAEAAALAARIEAEAEARLGPLLVFHEGGAAPDAPDHLSAFVVGPVTGASDGAFARAVAGATPEALRAARAEATRAGAPAMVWIDGFGGPLSLRDEDGLPGPLWVAATEPPHPQAVAGHLTGWGPEPAGWQARWWADGRNAGISTFQLGVGGPAPVATLDPDGPFTWFTGYDPASGLLTVFVDGDVGPVTLTLEEIP